jgi:RNA polymerase sigma-70 factor, ECF subfamily
MLAGRQIRMELSDANMSSYRDARCLVGGQFVWVLKDAGRTWPASAPHCASMAAHRGERGMNGPRLYAEATDEALVAWSADGDRRAFDEVVVRHGMFVSRVALRMVSDRSVAEDLAQEAMVRAWKQSSRFDPQRARFTTWLYRIVVNLCIDYRRKVQPMPMPDDFDRVDPAAGAHEVMESSERQRALARALRELPARQRAAMTLVYDEDMSGAEAARVLGLSAKAVERLLARARAYLRDRLIAEQI